MFKENTSKKAIFQIYGLFAVATIILLVLVRGYISYIVLGTFFAVITYSMFKAYLKLTAKMHYRNWLKIFWKTEYQIDGNKAIAALFTVLTTIAIIALTATIFGSFIGRNLSGLVNEGWDKSIDNIAANPAFKERFNQYGIDGEVLKEKVRGLSSQALSQFGFGAGEGSSEGGISKAANIGTVLIASVTNFIVYFVVFMFSWVVMLVSGESLMKFLYRFSFLDKDEQAIVNTDFIQAIKNVIIGNIVSGLLVVALVLIIGIYYSIPLLGIWAFLAFFIGFLPLSPSELSYVPLLIGIYFTRGATDALVVAAIIEVYTLAVNNLILPRITAGKETNPLLILVGVFSAITIFGFVGFVIGPVLVYIAMSFYKIAEKRRAALSVAID
jgi:predicted PurR-regulated permease PerM